MLIGPYLNGAAVIVGGLLGAIASKAISERVKSSLPLIFGLCSIGLGINLVIQVKYMPAVVLAMIIGTAIGEVLYVERGIGKAAGSTRSLPLIHIPLMKISTASATEPKSISPCVKRHRQPRK